jgi:RHH-type transcriptional regulator, proline utilization regulon repressor / proline dehydrogenase / delta 1-pyrroline-5-carboxylate dehydrogenase
VSAGSKQWEIARVVAAGLRAGASIDLSVDPAVELEQQVRNMLDSNGVQVVSEDVVGHGPARIRVIGSADVVALGPSTAVWSGEVTESGRIEMLPFLREQAISITRHRFGTVRERDEFALMQTNKPNSPA